LTDTEDGGEGTEAYLLQGKGRVDINIGGDRTNRDAADGLTICSLLWSLILTQEDERNIDGSVVDPLKRRQGTTEGYVVLATIGSEVAMGGDTKRLRKSIGTAHISTLSQSG
jgi:hypothetical protein